MRYWVAAASVAILAMAAACAPKPVVVPETATARYPEFLEPMVPASLAATVGATGQARAWRFLQAGDLRSAEREAIAAMKSTPDFYPAETTVAYVGLARKDAGGAVAAFDRVLSRHAEYTPALVGKGQALTALGRDDDAAIAFDAALRIDPGLTEVSRRRDVVRLRAAQRSITDARQFAKVGKFVEALDAYRAAIAQTPDSAFLYREMAVIERDHGNGDAAIDHFRRAVALDSSDVDSLLDLAAMLDARNEFDAAFKAYADALAVAPDPEVAARRDALRLRAEVARLPAEYRAAQDAEQITRGDLAALIGFRLPSLVAAGRPRDVGVITDIRGHWAECWVLEVSRAGIMDAFDNHTFQPGTAVTRVDFAQTMMRLLMRAVPAPSDARRWQSARGRFPDVSTSHAAHQAVSAVVAAGIMSVAADGSFQPSRTVSGADATAAIVRILTLADPALSRP